MDSTDTETPAQPERVPDIAGYWPDAPHRAGPPADHYEPDGAEAVRTTPAWQNRGPGRPTVESAARRPTREPTVISESSPVRRPAGRIVAATLAGALVAGVAGWYAFGSDDGGPATGPAAAPASTAVPQATVPATPPVSIEASVAPDAATFELADGTTELNVTIGATGDRWFQVSTPAGSGIRPRAVLEGGAVRLFVDKAGAAGSARVDVRLSPAVTWSVLMRGGVRTGIIDLTGGRVDRVDLLGGAAALDLRLPRQDGVVGISMSGGVHDWRITTGRKVPVRAVLRRGAGAVVLYGDRNQGVDKDTRFTVTGGTGGIDLIADEGVGTLTVAAGRAGGTIGG
ncbi:hypothetical protein [Actinoplanes utahensis]|uniref:hypothetical protein n=1 Tax=Actinoplanes utahensis TaxID=1869 RepID=UPI000690F387|nr:hypothetical protein [Actinoplanes utahensis]GIF29958.1 hypothetical protein Aut01nite_29440 [Actinoplanes utahensis]